MLAKSFGSKSRLFSCAYVRFYSGLGRDHVHMVHQKPVFVLQSLLHFWHNDAQMVQYASHCYISKGQLRKNKANLDFFNSSRSKNVKWLTPFPTRNLPPFCSKNFVILSQGCQFDWQQNPPPNQWQNKTHVAVAENSFEEFDK